MHLTVTSMAAEHVKKYLARRGKGIGIRLGIRTTGCSGMAYVVEYADHSEETDHVFEDKGIKIIVDPKSMIHLDGTELDFAREGLNEGFKFNNPNEAGRCGCGESFNI